MKLKILLTILLLIVVSVGAYFALSEYVFNTGGTNEESVMELVNLQRFSDESGNSIEVTFNPENATVTVSGNGYIGLVFKQTVSASGARYENKENRFSIME